MSAKYLGMRIERIIDGKKRFLALLLEADEQESMLDRYLQRGEMHAMFSAAGEAVCVAVVTDEGGGTCELKNLAVAPSVRRQGVGRSMVEHLRREYAPRFARMIVGTGNAPRTVGFYRACGFEYSHTVEHFFTRNYDHVIVDDGQVLDDMLYFSLALQA